MLKTVAGLLESAAKRAQDLAARIGGDEFAILLPNTELAPAVEIAGALRERIADLRLIAGSGEDTQMTVSIGVTCMRPAPDDPSDEFVDMADSYLYQAKNSGRNKVCFG